MFTVSIKRDTLQFTDSKENVLLETTTEEEDMSFATYGLFGLIILNLQKYLVFIVKAEEKGQIESKNVFEVKEAKVVVIGPNPKEKEAQKAKKSIEDFFLNSGVYFSDYELSNRSKINKEIGKEKQLNILDTTFLFNKIPIENLINNFPGKNTGILRCIQGYFYSYKDFVLISRRSPKRIGTRYFSRGINEEGFPSNFVETEQIIANRSAYVQVRGSIPLKWHHDVDFKYHPKINIFPSDRQLLTSFEKIQKIYKVPVIYLNLIRSTGYESKINTSFNNHVKNTSIVLYNYDFKKEISKSKFPFDFSRTGFTTKNTEQKEIIRTNCMDCLDRTNSMQYFIGRHIFDLQLKQAKIKNLIEYKQAYKSAFYENGNNISIQYAGTNAMSSYYITGGKKDAIGSLKDFQYSVTRYFINRFYDGKHHTILNLVTGNLHEGPISFATNIFTFKSLLSFRFILFVPVFFLLLRKSTPVLNVIIVPIYFIYLLFLLFPIDLPACSCLYPNK